MKNKYNNPLTPIPEKLALEFFDRAWDSPHELDAMDEDYCITTAGKTIKGRNKFKNWVGEFQKLLNATTESVAIFFNEKENKSKAPLPY